MSFVIFGNAKGTLTTNFTTFELPLLAAGYTVLECLRTSTLSVDRGC